MVDVGRERKGREEGEEECSGAGVDGETPAPSSTPIEHRLDGG